VYVATKIGLPDLLRDGPCTVSQLAVATGTDEDALARLLRALSTLELFEELADDTYAVTDAGALLQRGAPMWGLALMLGGEHYRVWGHLEESVRSGTSQFEAVYGKPFLEYLRDTPQTSDAFNESMTGLTAQTVRATIEAYDFGRFDRIVDVGGSHGALLLAILQTTTGTSGIVFDFADVADVARARFADAGLSDRGTAIAGNFLHWVPDGGDLYVLSRILQGLDDNAAIGLLRRCRDKVRPGGRLIIAEMVLTEENKRFTSFEDLHMLVVTRGGRIRSEPDHAALSAAAGLRVERIIPAETLLPFSIIECVPA
jgi:hypothetical protein